METSSLGKMTSALRLWIIITLLIFGYMTESSAQGCNSLVLAKEQEHLCSINSNTTTTDSSVTVQVDTKTTLSCFTFSVKNLLMATWEILSRDKAPCIVAYRLDNHEIKETNCFNDRVNWEFRPDWNLTLQIDPVTPEDDGYYKCTIVTSEGNFQCGYHLNVLVPPRVSLLVDGNGTATCKASAGKPAAQISWVPEGYCFSVNETHENKTVTVKSICHWNGLNESEVTCSSSHLTGNKCLSIELLPHRVKPSTLLPLYISLFVLFGLIIIVGFIFIWIIICHRIYKPQSSRFTPNINMKKVEIYANYMTKVECESESKIDNEDIK
ncbi:cell surface glycoprotein CD200 receptor 2-like [Gracilinanus agilis]|uniref:cell surface glycoprotein CD200 receptor 2-like n=1 Tax=Gracilinanus agilis TaxID=191870 RepID=UPI001CFE8D11|nr:cell surface glycoprotein CD200 receptor 2-like [Gracilinanus agilis]